MSRRKAAQNCTVLPWLSRRMDNSEGRFIQIGNSLLLSSTTKSGDEQNRFLQLSNGAKFLYLCMCMEAAGKREFEFTRTAARKYGIANSSLRNGEKELVEAGMIQKQSGKNARLPNRYTFCFEWKKAP